ncbi:MAG: hypothetical protein K2W82_05215 [Candidatus Obscuribacterales bacterium]|jgi:hypothetical protein|nr:hypothetical protein [Candidatus Obscuribacterales bacterium]
MHRAFSESMRKQSAFRSMADHDRASKTRLTVNMHGDVYKKNEFGQVITFRYAHSGVIFSFSYDAEGHVSDIDSSSGWVWKKIRSGDFEGWQIRNCFDRWYVKSTDCCDIFVGDSGVNAVGNNVAMMMLPEKHTS